MYGDTLPSNTEGGSLRRMHGAARVMFTHRDGQSRLAELDQRTPMRVLFPKVPAGTPPVAAVTTVSGGLVGGDTLDIEVSVGDRAAATAIGQAAEKVYRSNGPDSNVNCAKCRRGRLARVAAARDDPFRRRAPQSSNCRDHFTGWPAFGRRMPCVRATGERRNDGAWKSPGCLGSARSEGSVVLGGYAFYGRRYPIGCWIAHPVLTVRVHMRLPSMLVRIRLQLCS